MLAIVIPYYKITFFEHTLKSLANQTDNRFKVYIGDDASPEDPIDIIDDFSDILDLVYVKFDKNIGSKSLVKQWERCINLTQDEKWITILGDDDILSQNYVSEFYKHLDKIELENVNVIRFASAHINEAGEQTSKTYYHPEIETSLDFLFRKLNGGTRSSLSEYLFKKEVVKKVKFKDLPLAWFSDLLAVLEFSNFGKIFTINSSRVYFRYSNLNISGKRDNMKNKNESHFMFYYYLLNHSEINLTPQKKEILIQQMEKCVLLNRKNFSLLLKLLIVRLKYLEIGKIIRFIFHYFNFKKL